MEQKNASRVFVTGFLGSDRKGTAERLAQELGYDLIDLDREIEKKDGRSIQRICMMMGEHEYRNKEYEMLEDLSQENNIVVCCGDGIIFDDMNREILMKNQVLIADAELSAEELWEKAKNLTDSVYAFMHQTDEALKKEKFMELYWQRKDLYSRFS
ncbi:hypothetical protein LI177_10500 [bacterium 210820-DFI.6.37]|nr:hypothetical protein [bacterium 210820-DFI.6.37]